MSAYSNMNDVQQLLKSYPTKESLLIPVDNTQADSVKGKRTYRTGFPVLIITDVEWMDRKEEPLVRSIQVKYIHVKCFSSEQTIFHSKSFEFVGYWPSRNKEIPPPDHAAHLNKLTLDECHSFLGREQNISFPYTNNPFGPGLITWLGKNDGQDSNWTNPADKLKLTLSHYLHKNTMKKENVLNINTGEVTYWGGSVPMWFSIDLGPSKLFNTSCWCLGMVTMLPTVFLSIFCLKLEMTVMEITIGHCYTKYLDLPSHNLMKLWVGVFFQDTINILDILEWFNLEIMGWVLMGEQVHLTSVYQDLKCMVIYVINLVRLIVIRQSFRRRYV